MCCNEYNDNRNSCAEVTPSSCVPYTGYISETIKKDFNCKPNINDIFKKLQELIDEIKESLGDNSKIDLACVKDSLSEGFSQEEFNSVLLKELCELKNSLNGNNIDIGTYKLAVNLLCLTEPGCDIKSQYTIKELFNKLITSYCSLLTRVKNIETILNL